MDLQITIDCSDPDRQVRFWAQVLGPLGYVEKPPPDGHPTWRAFYLNIGVPEAELGEGDCSDRLTDPTGDGPDIWFQRVPEAKAVKNRLHLDLRISGGRTVPLAERRKRIDAEVERLVAAGATVAWRYDTEGVDHYGVTMYDPEGNEFCFA